MSVHHHKHFCHRNGKHIMGCLSYDPSCESGAEACILQWRASRKKKMNKIKWRFCWHICGGLLRCQLAAMAMMTYWQRLCRDTPSSIALLGLGQEISALELRQGKSRGGWWRLRASWMRMDEDIWLSAVRGLSGSVRNPHGRVEKTIGAWSQSANVAFLTCIPYHLLFFFSERNPWYFCLRVSPECF